MRDNLKIYLDSVFASAAKTRKNEELKEEILSNLYDKYDEYITEGMSAEDAYAKTISGIGDLSLLFEKLEREEPKSEPKQAPARILLEPESDRKRFNTIRTTLLTVAVALYILSVIPSAIFPGNFGPVMMFVMIAAATAMILCMPIFRMHTVPGSTDKLERERLRRENTLATIMLAAAVAGYILCVCPTILFSNGFVGVAAMFVIIAASTVAIILRSSIFADVLEKVECEPDPDEKKPDEKAPRAKKEKRQKTLSDKIFSVVSGIYWIIIVVVYFTVSAVTGRWEITWMIFVAALLLQGVVSGVYDLVLRRGTAGPIVRIVIFSVLLFTVFPSAASMLHSGARMSFFNVNGFSFYDDKGYEYGSVELYNNVDTLNIVWEDGSVEVLYHDEDYIEIREVYSYSSESVEDKDDQLRYKISGNTLDIREYSPVGIIFDRFESRGFSKDLVVLLPRVDMTDIDIDAVSSSVEIDSIVSEDINVTSVSGRITLRDCEVRQLDTESVSGELELLSCNVKEMDADTVSGGVHASFVSQPSDISIDTVSGSAELYFFDDISGFLAELDSVSGDFDSEFGTVGGLYGNGSIDIDMDSVSGDLIIKKLTAILT